MHDHFADKVLGMPDLGLNKHGTAPDTDPRAATRGSSVAVLAAAPPTSGVGCYRPPSLRASGVACNVVDGSTKRSCCIGTGLDSWGLPTRPLRALLRRVLAAAPAHPRARAIARRVRASWGRLHVVAETAPPKRSVVLHWPGQLGYDASATRAPSSRARRRSRPPWSAWVLLP